MNPLILPEATDITLAELRPLPNLFLEEALVMWAVVMILPSHFGHLIPWWRVFSLTTQPPS